jgi:hypothetical protein
MSIWSSGVGLLSLVVDVAGDVRVRKVTVVGQPSRPKTGTRTSSHLPLLADRLARAPQAALRATFEQLQLEVTYQPAASAIDVNVTLYNGSDPSQDCSVPPAGHNTNLLATVALVPTVLASAHTKIRRDGYRLSTRQSKGPTVAVFEPPLSGNRRAD